MNGLLVHLRPINERTDRMTAIIHWNDEVPAAITRLGRIHAESADVEQLCRQLVDEVLWKEVPWNAAPRNAVLWNAVLWNAVRDWSFPLSVVSLVSLDALDEPIRSAARLRGFESLAVEPLIAPASDEAIGCLAV